MRKFLGFLSFCLGIVGIYCGPGNWYSDYFHVLDEFSFNLRNKSTRNVPIEHWERDGDVVVLEDAVMMNSGLNNSHAFFYSPYLINSSTFEVHFRFNQTPVLGYGSAFALWIFDSPIDFVKNQTRNASYMGFTPDFNGFGIMFLAPGKLKESSYRSLTYFKTWNGTSEPNDLSFGSVTMYNSCERYLNRIDLVRIVGKATTTSIHFKDVLGVNSECVLNRAITVNKPFRIGFSTYNGKMDNLTFISSILLRRVTVFNSDIKSRNTSLIVPEDNEERLSRKRTKTVNNTDLVENFNFTSTNSTVNIFSLEIDVTTVLFKRLLREYLKNHEDLGIVSCDRPQSGELTQLLDKAIKGRHGGDLLDIVNNVMCYGKYVHDRLVEGIQNESWTTSLQNFAMGMNKFLSHPTFGEVKKLIFSHIFSSSK